ncbi:hypothetical protein H5410_044233 [Solanum commersonii]|uniref:Probable glutathione S-transferase n=1 Tax=Solanum commersonii TaxID=4109 RepID=A0A9J5X7W4_SOLCO|nr:hypothetical protein H5410_044233 [Solanum commersonii]
MEQVKLLGFWYSPFTHRVEWALKIKGVKYEYIEEDRYNKSPLLLESNPIYKKVPVLIHNGKPICDSMVILEYIDETFEGPSILPKDSHDRALARFWAKFLDDKVVTVVNAFLRKGEEQEKAKQEVCEMLKILDNELKDKTFFVANKFGYADIVANLVGLWLGVFQEGSGVELVTSEKFPNFCGWRDDPFSHRVEWALNIKDVKYEYIEEDRNNKSSLLLQSNPIHKKIPVLIHNGKPICESMVIVEYIDETFEGPSILPKDPYDRALAHFWAKFLDDKYYRDCCRCVVTMVNTFLRKGEEKEVCEMLKVLDNELKDKKLFVGDKFGFADMAANFVGLWLGIFQEASGIVLITSEKISNFCAWRDEYVNCSQVKEYLPPRNDELLAFFQGRVHTYAAASASTLK